MRILLSAFAISPFHGSEFGVGWQMALRLAQHHNVTVIYGDLDGRGAAKRELQSWLLDHHDIKGITPVYVPPGRFSMICERLHLIPGLRILYYWGYNAWQKRALKAAQSLHGSEPFDLVHHVTYTGYWEPGYLWKLGIPFFWGPVGGASTLPLGFISILGITGALEAVARIVLKRMRPFTHPRIHAAARNSTHVWCVTPHEQALLAPSAKSTSIMLETGTVDEDPVIRQLGPNDSLHLVWSGMHLPIKALRLLFEATRLLKTPERVTIHILNAAAGREQTLDRARTLAKRCEVPARLVWHGKLPHEHALAVMRQAHVLVHTSVKEGGTTSVALEALSQGMPVICHDSFGLAFAVTAECGIKIPLISTKQSILGFADAIQSLIDNPENVETLSIGAAKRAKSLLWEEKITDVLRTYDLTLEMLPTRFNRAAGGISVPLPLKINEPLP